MLLAGILMRTLPSFEKNTYKIQKILKIMLFFLSFIEVPYQLYSIYERSLNMKRIHSMLLKMFSFVIALSTLAFIASPAFADGFQFINVTGTFEPGVGIKEPGVGILSCQKAENGIAVNPDGYQLNNKNGTSTLTNISYLILPENENPKGKKLHTQLANKIAIPSNKMKDGVYKLYVTDLREDSNGKLFIFKFIVRNPNPVTNIVTINEGGKPYLLLTFMNGDTRKVDLSSLAGLKGDKGDQGLAGPKGDKGDKGEQGSAGTSGEGGSQLDYQDGFASSLEKSPQTSDINSYALPMLITGASILSSVFLKKKLF